jgi:hypothetical protein
MILKFNSSSLPSAAIVSVFNIRQEQIAPPNVMGYLATDERGDDHHLENGDFLFVNNGNFKIIKQAVYAANANLRRLVAEDVSRELIGDITQAVEDIGALSDADKITLLKYIDIPLILMAASKLSVARRIANGLATTALYTTGRKTNLLNLMDAAIAKL